MPTERDMIGTAERENAHDRPRDAIQLLCTVVLIYHRHLLDLDERVSRMEKAQEAAKRPVVPDGRVHPFAPR